ncbi:HNH endonuclease [Nocardioides sp. J2M5]|uniref:HNH endonuclease n=1 Tax=Nocardioides palaemonis TaxID=2829810 RepID=UPI001BA4BEB8|nr:HNH endonuclease [Nocardioides palaemonis]MBS2939581.1 HNH endonuclease [Nocardioides palaemonis]
MATKLPAPCGRCGVTIAADADPSTWIVGHIRSRAAYPELMLEPSNWRHEHDACSRKTAQAAVIEKAKVDALRAAGLSDAEIEAVFPHETDAQKPPLLPAHTHGGQDEPLVIREGLSWADLCQAAPEWLKPYLVVPGDASPPLWVSPVHAESVGSYGPEAIEWMESNLRERGRPLRFRWWQKLAIVLQLQHREDGTLPYRVILESGPRRIGKSVRLRGMALWRLAKGPELFEDEQLVLHTGKDLAIVREVMRKAWPWAEARDDWSSKKGMTEPQVAYREVNRWVARSKDSTTGYDACLALVDESWDVPPASIDDDLEPTMLERESPQLLLTSTAHRRATSLMRGRIIDTLAVDDGETLLLVWGAPVGADLSDRAVWRAASPHWSADREKMMESKYEKALAGETDPEADDPDPIEAFKAQYLNMWKLRHTKRLRGTALVEPDAWAARTAAMPDTVPTAVAAESWFAEGISVAIAWATTKEGPALVRAIDVEDAAAALELARATGYRGPLLLGASLADDPAFRTTRKKAMKARVGAAVQDLDRLLSEGAIQHDGGEHLTGQVLEVRTMPGADGPRLVSNTRADAVKAVAWATSEARRRAGASSRMVLPSSA